MGRLEGKVAVITGANSGIGLATARRFAEEGARVFMTGRRQAKLEAAVREVGHGARGVLGDVSNSDDLDRFYDAVRTDAGAIDVVVANAGGGEPSLLAEMTEAHYRQVFDTNVLGTVLTVQKALPLLRDGASVILMGSTSADTGFPGASAYAASKAAIRSFARSWAVELAPQRIRVTVLTPGATSTPGWHGIAPSEALHQAMVDQVAATTPLGRLADPSETAAAALFLASDDARFVTGSELYVDGGAAQV
jgi:NAD(P)-dependent dehydrogenase (short-subunit alcohol dehydrogenase family)